MEIKNPSPEQQIKRLDSLKSSEERQNFETLWQAGADFCNPSNSDIQTISAKGQRRKVRRVIDTGIEARRKFATGMYSYAIGTGNFFDFQPVDKQVSELEEVKRWLNDVVSITHYELKSSNFDAEVLQGFGELSYIGTTGTFCEWHEGRLNFKTQHISQMWIDVDARGRVNRVFIEIPLTAEQIIDEFGSKNVPDKIIRALKAGGTETFRVVQSCFKNRSHKPESILPAEREYISQYIIAEGSHLLREDGYNTFPFSVARLYKAKNEMYGRSCYMDASQTINLLNDERMTIIRGANLRADPPWIQGSDANVRHIKTDQVHKVIFDPTSLSGEPKQMDIRSDVGINAEMLEMDKETVFEAFYINAFNPLMGEKNMTAFETSQRLDIGLSQVSPALNKWQIEYATPLLERVYDILLSKGKYPEMPDALNGKEFKIEYISKASLALKQIELYGIMNTYEKMMQVAQFQPQVMDNFDTDEMVRISADVDNVPNSVILPSEDVEEIRAVRAEQMEKQQMMENAPAMADAAYKASQIEKEQ